MRGEDTGRHRAITTILSPPPPPQPLRPLTSPSFSTLQDGRGKIVLTSFFGYNINGIILFG